MNPVPYATSDLKIIPAWKKFLPARQALPLIGTLLVAVLLYSIASIRYDGFFSADVFIGFFKEKGAMLGLIALGETFVILSGGIDLSVGAMIGFSSTLLAVLVVRHHWPPLFAIPVILLGGTIFGTIMGSLIQAFSLTPFLITLGGLFVLQGSGFLVSIESLNIDPTDHPLYQRLSEMGLHLFGLTIPLTAEIFLVCTVILVLVSIYTPFGRNVYALGGNEQSAVLMGLPVATTRIGVYALSGFCSAMAGVVWTIFTLGGDPNAGGGAELDAIAAVVVGSTLLSGGVGYVSGTPLGVMVFAIIQTAIVFDGKINSWWTRIAIGGLLLVFIVLQRIIQPRKK